MTRGRWGEGVRGNSLRVPLTSGAKLESTRAIFRTRC